MKEVRRKYVLYAMLAVFVLLFAILAIINITNFTMAAEDADAITARLSESKGRFTDKKQDGEMPGNPAFPQENTVPGSFSSKPFTPDGFGPMGPDSPETSFSLRYFTVRFAKDGEAKLTAYQIAAVTEEEAISWAESLQGKDPKNDVCGWTRGTYRYRCYNKGDAVFVTVIDQGRELTPSYRILIVSLIGMGFGLIVSFLFLSLISRKLFRPLEDADRKQRQFILEAEKEFKIPLTVIQADTELIERENGPSDYTSSIHRQVNRMADLTAHLGSLAVFSDDSVRESCSISAIFREAAKVLDESDISLTEQYDESISLSGNPELFRRVADELITNISRFALTKASVTTEKKEKRIIVTLTNDCDLPDGSADNVFDRFIRLENAENIPGAGLGLSFVKDAVHQMGGRVQARIEDRQFILRLLL